MPETGLVALAATLRQLLASPQSLVPESKDEQNARLDIIDMIPHLNRTLVGDKQTLRDLAWSVSGPVGYICVHLSWSSRFSSPLDSLLMTLRAAQHLQVLSLRAIYRFKIPHLVPAESSITYESLATHVPVPLVSLRRLIRHAMTSNIFHEPTPNHVAHTPSSLLLATDPKILGWVDLFTENIWPAATYTNEALEKWPGSISPQETGFSIGVRSAMAEAPMAGKTSLYQEVSKDPATTVRFRDAMEYFSSGEGYEVSSLVENYDWASLGNGTVVDVGGANGFASYDLSQSFPSLNLVVQDIVMNDAMSSEHKSPQIKFMAHDFFTPQPIKGADVYLLRWILHNWPDEQSVEILRNLIPALKKGSKVLINDGCLPEPGKGRWFDERASRNIDITMMAAMNAREREEGDWAILFSTADPKFRFLGARKPENSRIWIIEAVWEGDGPAE